VRDAIAHRLQALRNGNGCLPEPCGYGKKRPLRDAPANRLQALRNGDSCDSSSYCALNAGVAPGCGPRGL
jgi:hypothetical protein